LPRAHRRVRAPPAAARLGRLAQARDEVAPKVAARAWCAAHRTIASGTTIGSTQFRVDLLQGFAAGAELGFAQRIEGRLDRIEELVQVAGFRIDIEQSRHDLASR